MYDININKFHHIIFRVYKENLNMFHNMKKIVIFYRSIHFFLKLPFSINHQHLMQDNMLPHKFEFAGTVYRL